MATYQGNSVNRKARNGIGYQRVSGRVVPVPTTQAVQPAERYKVIKPNPQVNVRTKEVAAQKFPMYVPVEKKPAKKGVRV